MVNRGQDFGVPITFLCFLQPGPHVLCLILHAIKKSRGFIGVSPSRHCTMYSPKEHDWGSLQLRDLKDLEVIS